MGGLSIWHLLILGIVVMLLFGKGRISDIMGDTAKGIKAFKKGISEEENAPVEARQVTQAAPAADATSSSAETVTRS
jgi:sec-independent protein translocase protein TatA